MFPTYHYDPKHDASLSASHARIVPFSWIILSLGNNWVLIPSQLELEQPPTTHLFTILPSTSRNNHNFYKYATHVPIDALFQHGRGARVCVCTFNEWRHTNAPIGPLACFKLQTNFCRISHIWQGISRAMHVIRLKKIYQMISYFILYLMDK